MSDPLKLQFYEGNAFQDDGKDNIDLGGPGISLLEKKMDTYPRLSRSQEAVATLLASFGDDVEDCAENFTSQDITFKELATLNREDLNLLGIKDPQKQDKILETFSELPKQNRTYDEVVNSDEAREYNAEIMNKISLHLKSMRTSLSATDLKLRVKPSSDVVLEDKSFASKFVLEALDELKKITEEIEERLALLEEITDGKVESRTRFYETAVMAGLAIASIAVWFWKCR